MVASAFATGCSASEGGVALALVPVSVLLLQVRLLARSRCLASSLSPYLTASLVCMRLLPRSWRWPATASPRARAATAWRAL